ncbi:hypothetical protein MRS76_19800 [Rhizobiaceae bacterium n13]|uniref:Uncharacterized protein n=1 Tax=Ferirhizobium litorale TaxID=2927786 RepID=A0AAE3QEU6_9HYPH|nr:hypothetical protein [Fererhizobium litorale]MDI7864189.1 hypothetical protein [Fererhizobium litorale]MDI7923800.1 hypothetical protein [Fererhizobium litorale]
MTEYGFPVGLEMDVSYPNFQVSLTLLSIGRSGRFRPALHGEGVFPRPHQQRLPLWVPAARRSPSSAGDPGLPLAIAIIGCTF